MRHDPLSLTACLAFAACAGGGDPVATDPSDPFGGGSVPAALRGAAGGREVQPGGNLADLAGNVGVVLDEEDIVFTDPDADNPEDLLPELEELLDAAPEEGPWRESFTLTLREARRLEKPILIWFTDSQNSPPCRALSEELFSRQEFESWAAETFVRLQVDQRVRGSKLDHEVASKSDYIEGLKERFKVHGQPTLLVLSPGENKVIGKYRGYSRGQSEYKWGQLRQGAVLAERSHEEWKASMRKRGYRDWTGPRGRSIFAKLLRYREGRLVLSEPDGHRFQTKERYLSPEDQDWIAEQKRRRGLD